MIPRAALFAVPVTVLFALYGCAAAGPSLVGKWTGQVEVGGSKVPADIEVKADQTMTMEIETGGVRLQMISDCTIKGDKITMKVKDMKVVKLPKEQEDKKELIEAQLSKAKGEETTNAFKFEGEDKVTLISTGAPVTWTRVK
ncbi:MAG: hypothetical protein LCH41_07600 [Armatimonadetes bacterium]|nr:hypothetical protein [Armatimonadota bacterium]